MSSKNDLLTKYKNRLLKTKEQSSLRSLKEQPSNDYVNFASNDYLGLSNEIELQRDFLEHKKTIQFGATGSRLLTGNNQSIVDLENMFRNAFNMEALVFHSGYEANSCIIETLFEKDDVIFLDKLNHASIFDAAFKTGAKIIPFNHLEYDDLKHKMKKYRHKYKNAIIITESTFSMDGDMADLNVLVEIKNIYNSFLYVDEAHSFGLYGSGWGIVKEMNLETEVDFVMLPFGKAICSSGAVVVLNEVFKNYIINYGRKFIFTTAPSPIVCEYTTYTIKMITNDHKRRDKLFKNIEYFGSNSPIIPVIVGDEKVDEVYKILLDNNIFALPIKPPTVPKGTSRIRIVLNANHTYAEIDLLKKVLNEKNIAI